MTLYNFAFQLTGKVHQYFNYVALNLLDYGVLIKHPMDLGTIVKKINEEKYMYVEEILDDIQLVWDNCKLYNPPSSVI